MKTNNYNRYKLKISKSHCSCAQANGIEINHFIAPDTHAGTQKLYVVKNGSDVCYVGITSQPISSRLRIGFIDSGHYGYHGYKWKDKITEAELLIWCFSDKDHGFVEGIEGELVYLIRYQTGKWPKYQMEIHFHQASKSQIQIAKSILGICLGEETRNK